MLGPHRGHHNSAVITGRPEPVCDDTHAGARAVAARHEELVTIIDLPKMSCFRHHVIQLLLRLITLC